MLSYAVICEVVSTFLQFETSTKTAKESTYATICGSVHSKSGSLNFQTGQHMLQFTVQQKTREIYIILLSQDGYLRIKTPGYLVYKSTGSLCL